uniref:Uncharacterized protein n=1 Tax=Coccidioides posadasii RMSCC 3488 TaxID=454284 RepID=A0A0J6FS77_COCPO|nr:hypothetical protein CPAG_08577 [Coccidioides posadasii RMSCC 3488]
MSHARVEDVSDSDPDEMDPADFDPRNAAQSSVISPANRYPATLPMLSPPSILTRPGRALEVGSPPEAPRRDPLARDISMRAAARARAASIHKIHPKIGRTRAAPGPLKREDGQPVNEKVKNKHHLYIFIANYLQVNPTTEKSPYRLRIRGLPTPEKPLPPPSAPRGWKMGTILPFHSPAYSGGGVTDNPFKEAMMEMQAQQGIAPNGGEAKKKKEKRKTRA